MPSLLSVVPEIGFVCNPIKVTTKTGLINSTDFGMQITFGTDPMPVAFGSFFSIIINGETFTWKPEHVVNDPCNEMPVYNGDMLALMEGVRNSFYSKFHFLCNYDITIGVEPLGASGSIYIKPKVPGDFIASIDYGVPGIISYIVDSALLSDKYNVENLSAYIATIKIEEDGVRNKLSQQNAPYEVNSREACFDVRKSFDLDPIVPELSLQAVDLIHSPSSYCHYMIGYADRYGEIPKIDCLNNSGQNYFAIAGGLSPWNDMPYFEGNIELLHNYPNFDQPEVSFMKPISRLQEDWLYFFIKETSNLKGSINVEFEDNTSIVLDVFATDPPIGSPGPVNVEGGKVYYLPSGYKNLNLDELDKKVCRYTYILTDVDNVETLRLEYEVIPEFQENGVVLVMSSGLGGFESVIMLGENTWSYQAAFDSIVKAYNDESNGSRQVENINSEGFSKIVLNTGLVDLNYLGHLRQLFHSKLWMIIEDRFIPLSILTKEISFDNQYDQLEKGHIRQSSLSFEFRIAWENCQFNTNISNDTD